MGLFTTLTLAPEIFSGFSFLFSFAIYLRRRRSNLDLAAFHLLADFLIYHVKVEILSLLFQITKKRFSGLENGGYARAQCLKRRLSVAKRRLSRLHSSARQTARKNDCHPDYENQRGNGSGDGKCRSPPVMLRSHYRADFHSLGDSHF